MDPVTLVIVPGFVGGLAIALLFAKINRMARDGNPDATELPSTDVINMARIRVAGIGGLGLVAMAVFVALYLPRIRQSMALGLALGALFGLALILWRRRVGPMPSSGRRAGANTTLSIDQPATPLEDNRKS